MDNHKNLGGCQKELGRIKEPVKKETGDKSWCDTGFFPHPLYVTNGLT